MGFFSSIKRLLFVGESVAKSAVDKTTETVKEGASDLANKAKEVAKETSETVIDKTSGLRESILDGAGDAFDKSKEVLGDIKDKAVEVAEDATETAGEWFEKGRDNVKEAKDSVSDLVDNNPVKEAVAGTSGSLKDKASEVLGDVGETAGEWFEKSKDTVGGLVDKASETAVVKKAADLSETVGDKVLTAGEQFMEKAKDFSESVGEKVLAAGGVGAEKAGDLSEKIGEKVLEAKDAVVERAKEVTADLGEKLDETIVKAEKMAAEEAATPKKDFSDETLTTGDSLLDGTDDFFAKAAQYGGGDFDAFDDGSPKIVEEIVENKSTGGLLELPDDEGNSRTAGFTDNDNDGDDVIDDAEVIGEEE